MFRAFLYVPDERRVGYENEVKSRLNPARKNLQLSSQAPVSHSLTSVYLNARETRAHFGILPSEFVVIYSAHEPGSFTCAEYICCMGK